MSSSRILASLLESCQIRAAAFIVTLYGDIVEPRGGVLWVGNIIESCAAVGISENLVRTAVSRLVSAGQLEGERAGRRSYYRLTASARTEFSYAAKILYNQQAATQWRLVYVDGPDAEAIMRSLKRLGYAALNGRMAIGSESVLLPPEVLVWQADILQGQFAIQHFVAEHWDLPKYAEAYQGFILHFEPVVELLEQDQLDAATALTLRLLMVHEYRHIALRAPHFPAEVLPETWEGYTARQLFARLYLLLSKKTDPQVGAHFIHEQGALAAQTLQTEQRLERLAALL